MCKTHRQKGLKNRERRTMGISKNEREKTNFWRYKGSQEFREKSKDKRTLKFGQIGENWIDEMTNTKKGIDIKNR